MEIDFSMTNDDETMTIDWGDPEPLPADLAAKDAAWGALERAVDEWIEANPDPQGKIKTHEDIGFLPPPLPFGWMTANDWDSIQQRANEIASLPGEIDWGAEDEEDSVPFIQYRGLPKTRTGEQLQEGSRQWQSEAYSVWLGLPDERKRMTTAAATGAGKTRLAITIEFNWFHEQGHLTGKLVGKTGEPVVVMVAPTSQLVNQHQTTCRMWGLNVGRVGGGYKEVAPNKQVYITTYNSLKKVAALSHLKNRPVLLVLDECHRAGGVAALRTLRKYQGDACLLLSATPNRSDGVCVMHEMNTHPEGASCIGGRDCKVGIQYTLNLIDGIKQSRNGDDELDFTFHVVHVGMTPAEQIEYDDLTEQISKAYWKCYNAADKTPGANKHNLFDRNNFNVGGLLNEVVSFSQAGKPMTILHMYQYLCNKRKRLMNEMESRFALAQQVLVNNIGKKYALMHETIFGIERLNGMCKDIGIHPHIYHSGLSVVPDHVFVTYPELNNAGFKRRLQQYRDDSAKELKRWERSSSDILLSCKSLKEGFDAPDMDGIIMMSGTNSVGSRIQTIGRVFRGAKHKDIWMFVYPSNDGNPSGDERSLAELLDKTGIPPSHLVYHVNGVNPAHLS